MFVRDVVEDRPDVQMHISGSTLDFVKDKFKHRTNVQTHLPGSKPDYVKKPLVFQSM